MTRRGRGRWLVAGGLVGLALSPGARRAGIGLRARATRLRRGAGDGPVAPFLEAPCHQPDRVAAEDAARTEAAR